MRTTYDSALLLRAISAKSSAAPRPIVVALDGRSGVGKSTLARDIAAPLGAALIEGDDFFMGGVVVRRDSPMERAAHCIDWRRQRAALLALRRSEPASWHAFDWEAFDGSLERKVTGCLPAPVVVLEGVYSARPELADLVDLRVLVCVPEELRLRRLIEREGSLSPWELQWHEAEDHYFAHVVRRAAFDLVLGHASTPANS